MTRRLAVLLAALMLSPVLGAARAAEAAGDQERAKAYYVKLLELTRTADSERPEVVAAKAFVAAH